MTLWQQLLAEKAQAESTCVLETALSLLVAAVRLVLLGAIMGCGVALVLALGAGTGVCLAVARGLCAPSSKLEPVAFVPWSSKLASEPTAWHCAALVFFVCELAARAARYARGMPASSHAAPHS